MQCFGLDVRRAVRHTGTVLLHCRWDCLLMIPCSKIAEAEAAVSVNEKKWLGSLASPFSNMACNANAEVGLQRCIRTYGILSSPSPSPSPAIWRHACCCHCDRNQMYSDLQPNPKPSISLLGTPEHNGTHWSPQHNQPHAPVPPLSRPGQAVLHAATKMTQMIYNDLQTSPTSIDSGLQIMITNTGHSNTTHRCSNMYLHQQQQPHTSLSYTPIATGVVNCCCSYQSCSARQVLPSNSWSIPLRYC
jgi:hypothetical protein